MTRAPHLIVAVGVALGACSKPVPIPVHDLRVPVAGPVACGRDDRPGGLREVVGVLRRPGIGRSHRASPGMQRGRASGVGADPGGGAEDRVIAGAADRPELSLGINRIRQRQNFVGLPFPGLADRVLSNTFSNAGLSFNVAWEADIWNRVAADKLAAEANTRMREAELLGARLSLSAQVAKGLVRGGSRAQRQIRHRRAGAGESGGRSSSGGRSASRLAPVCSPMCGSLKPTSPGPARHCGSADRRADAFVRQTETLTCQYPAGELSVTAELAALPEQVPAGLPSELVHRRPDLIAAEQALLAADARIVQARATLRPSFALTSALGTSSNTLADLVNPNLQIWNYAFGLAQPIFNRGRLKANVRITQERAIEQEALYQARVWDRLQGDRDRLGGGTGAARPRSLPARVPCQDAHRGQARRAALPSSLGRGLLGAQSATGGLGERERDARAAAHANRQPRGPPPGAGGRL